MLNLPPSVKIFLAREPADMRRSFDGLAELVRQNLGSDPLSGHLFVFRGKRGDRIKVLYWDEAGLTLWYKRLEEGNFRFPPTSPDVAKLEIRSAELTLLLDGVDLASVKRQKRYRRAPTTPP